MPKSLSDLDEQNLIEFDKLMRTGKSTRELLDFTDNIVLQEACGLSSRDITRLRIIYLKLLRRRLKRWISKYRFKYPFYPSR